MNNYTYTPKEQFKRFYNDQSIIAKLLLINIVFFLIVNLIHIFLFLFQLDTSSSASSSYGNISYWLSVPANVKQLLHRPWTIITYMFLQEGFFHLLFNMMILFFGGRIFLEYLTQRQLLKTYILSGICGAIFFIASFNFFPVFLSQTNYAVAMGSSASVLGILIAIATYVPNYSVFLFLLGKIKIKYIAIFFIFIDILSIPKGNAGGHIAHIGGAIWGFIYGLSLKQGHDIFSSLNNLSISSLIPSFFKKKKDPFTSIHVNNSRPLSDEAYNKRKKEQQKQIDHILDKISKSGYESLTKEEKTILFNSSNK